MNKISEYFEKDGAPKKCTVCDSANFKDHILGVVDVYQGMGPTSEMEVICKNCGEILGYWAYGGWHPEFKRAYDSQREERSL